MLQAQLAQDLARPRREVAADPNLGLVDVDWGGEFPVERGRLLAISSSTEHQDVGDGLGAGRTLVSTRREPHGAHQVAQGLHLTTGRRIRSVKRVPRRDDGHQAARTSRGQALDDEVVVDRVIARVVERIMQADVTERHVPDDGVDATRNPGVRERLRPDVGVRVQPRRNPGSGRVQLDADHGRPVRRRADERAGTAARLEDDSPVEPELLQRRPHLTGDLRRRVVRVDRGPTGRTIRRVVQQRPQLRVLRRPARMGVVEDLRDSSPTRPPGQHLALVDRRGAVLDVELLHEPDRVNVGPIPGLRPRRRQVLDTRRPEPL